MSEIRQLAGEPAQRGAELTAPRRVLPVLESAFEPEDVVELKLRSPLPLKSAEDRPAHGELLHLQDRSRKLADEEGRRLGPEGASNALTDPARELHRFSGTLPARLEAEGWQFCGADGDLLAGQNGGPWLSERLDRFAVRLEALGSEDLVRRLEEHPGDLPRLLEGLEGEDRRKLAAHALSEMAPMENALDAGNDRELQSLWLAAAAPRDGGARVAHEVHRSVDFAREQAWQAALEGGDALAMAGRLAQGSEKLPAESRAKLSRAILSGLAESCPAARAAAGWNSRNPATQLAAILADPAIAPAALAETLADHDPEGQRRYLAEIQSPMLSLHEKLGDWRAASAVFREGLQSSTDLAERCRGIQSRLVGVSFERADHARLGQWMLGHLATLPSHRQAAEAVLSWGSKDPYRAAAVVLENPTASPDELARQSIQAWDPEAQRRYLAQIDSPMLAVHEQLGDHRAYSVVFREALRRSPDVPQSFESIQSALAGVSCERTDRARIGQWMLEQLAVLPTHCQAAEAARSWGTSDPYQAAAVVLQNPAASPDEIARRSIKDWDPEAQRRYLAHIESPMLAVHEQLGDDRVYAAVFKEACQKPTDLPRSFQNLQKALTGVSCERTDRARLGQWMLEQLTTLPTHRLAAETALDWGTRDPFQAAAVVLQNPAASPDEIARRSIKDWDPETQRRYLAQIESPMLAVHEQLSDERVCAAVFKEACRKPTDLPRSFQNLENALSGVSCERADRARLGQWMLEQLTTLPGHRQAAEAARGWEPSDPFRAAMVVVRSPGLPEGELARNVLSEWDAEGQRRFMKGSPLLDLHRQLSDYKAYSAVFRQACAGTPDLQQLFQSMAGQSIERVDRQKVGQFALERLAARPDSKLAAEAVLSWGPRDAMAAAGALMQNPHLSTPPELDALALAAISPWDKEAQGRHLAQVAARPGAPPWLARVQALHQKLQDDRSYGAVWQLAIQSTSGDLQAVADSLAGLTLSQRDRAAVEELVGVIRGEIETRNLVAGLQEKSQTVAVEQDRVVVGGVVVRRKP